MIRVVKLTDISGAERVPPDDDWTVLATGVKIKLGENVWSVVSVGPQTNSAVIER